MLSLREAVGQEIEDPEEGLNCLANAQILSLNVTETFLLFSQSIPSQNLGFVDSKASILDITVGNRDLTIHQSPTILSSNRGGGTTGAGS